MNIIFKITSSLLTLFLLVQLSGCSPTETIEPVESPAPFRHKDFPTPSPIPPFDPAPPNKKKIITVPAPATSPLTGKNIATPADVPHLGLLKIDGSDLLTSSDCPNIFQDRRSILLCIKIPDEPVSNRRWWVDKYVEQLVTLGWAKGLSQGEPLYITTLSGKLENGCRSTIIGLIFNEDNRDLFYKDDTLNNSPRLPINGTYLIFSNLSVRDCTR